MVSVRQGSEELQTPIKRFMAAPGSSFKVGKNLIIHWVW
jgi:hypothetical protein